jgi:LacI family transcriptional regulator
MEKIKPATQADVAQVAGVSQTTVSYIVNQKDANIPEETRQRVLDAIKDLGYTPNRAARTLRTSKTHTIACIIPEITNPFFYPVVRGIQDVAEIHEYDLVIYNSDSIQKKEHQLLRSIQKARVDGLIGMFVHITGQDLCPLLAQGIAITKSELGPVDYGDMPIDTIFVDNIAASAAAVSHLIEGGHRRIGMLGGASATPRDYRIRGYSQGLAQHGIAYDDTLVVGGDFTLESGYEKMQRLLELEVRPTAVFASNDLMAIGAMQAIMDAGLSIPQDVAVMGFDNIPSAQLITPRLSTVEHFPQPLGERAAAMLFERMSGQAPKHGRSTELPFELVLRETT